MDVRRMAGRTALLVALALLACGDESIAPRVESDPEPVVENRGVRVTGSVPSDESDGLIRWLWMDSRKAAFLVDSDRELERGVWVVDLLGLTFRHVLELDSPRALAFARQEGRLYVSGPQGLDALDPGDPEPPPTSLSSEARSFLSVSPGGRYRVEELPGGGALLIDTGVGDTLALESVSRTDRVTDDGTLLFARTTGVGALELATATVRSWEYPTGVGDLRLLRGPSVSPQATFAEASGGARTLEADESSEGFRELHRAPVSGPVHSSTFDHAVARSPDGRRYVFGVVRSVRASGSGLESLWEIVVYDTTNGESKVIANGVSAGAPHGLAISPDGTRLLYGVEGNLYLVELD